MSAILTPEVTRLALCWRLARRDGVTLGFTTHDRDLSIGGLVYRASPGMMPSAVSVSDGFDASALDISGAMTSDAIRAEDLSAGRWDGAEMRLFLVDWSDPAGEQVGLARGTLGEVGIDGQGFVAELKGPAAALERPVVALTSPMCRAALGDPACRVDMAPRTRIARIVAVHDAETISVDDAIVGDACSYGRIRWIDGANSGLSVAVLRSEGPRLTLRDPPRLAMAVGERIELREGCDKALSTCAGRFANAVNFRGEPHLPGLDLLTRYPGAA